MLIWKVIPDNIIFSKSLNEFKAKIKEWKPDSYNCHIYKTFIPELGFTDLIFDLILLTNKYFIYRQILHTS